MWVAELSFLSTPWFKEAVDCGLCAVTSVSGQGQGGEARVYFRTPFECALSPPGLSAHLVARTS